MLANHKPFKDIIIDPDFEKENIELEIDKPMPGYTKWLEDKRAMRAPDGTLDELKYAYQYPLLTKEQERHLFKRMNYHKWKYKRLIEKLDKTTSSSKRTAIEDSLNYEQ